ncbi:MULTISPECIES: RNA polymerase sigma factor [Streptomyces]|uniref:RNA polymerase sigma factor n=1 Tax=Streptomyces TaxID=1883 RepID=UPI000F73942F|nr:sigma-70 family RNA polymerase sigma factor [Streptomyces sp. WAC05292]RSS80808.1 sigma-70 family RNA polymerase sigma factor [Streptomyces sp. WAC05292]
MLHLAPPAPLARPAVPGLRRAWRGLRALLLREPTPPLAPAGLGTSPYRPAQGRGYGPAGPGGDPGPGGAAPRPTVSGLYHAHRLGMVRLAVLLVDDLATAEDVVQDAFTALYRRHGEDIADVDNALGYLRTAVVNTSRSVLRRRRTARAWTPPAPVDVPSAEERVVLDEAHREVLAALARLTPRRRQVLVLRYWAELSEAEIASTLGISRGAVKSNASRALDALERILEGRT